MEIKVSISNITLDGKTDKIEVYYCDIDTGEYRVYSKWYNDMLIDNLCQMIRERDEKMKKILAICELDKTA
jgi:hypothetical protein